jgi:hypothetical protein
MIRDRGTKKWQGFMMPEHIRELRKLRDEERKQPRPILDELKIEEMESLLNESLVLGTWLEITTWKNGFFTKRVCRVKQFNMYSKDVVFLDEFERKIKEQFLNVTNVIVLS